MSIDDLDMCNKWLTVGSRRAPEQAMASPFSWPLLVSCGLRAPAVVNLGVIDKHDWIRSQVAGRAIDDKKRTHTSRM